MKIILILLCLCSPLFASQFRTFTDEESSRTLKAILVGKSPGGEKITLRLESGRVVTVETKRLIEADRIYVERWITPHDQLTCRVDGKPFRGYKSVTVQAKAGPENATLNIEPGVYDQTTRMINPFKTDLKAGETFSQSFVLPNKYTVTLSRQSGGVIDQESHARKTGMK